MAGASGEWSASWREAARSTSSRALFGFVAAALLAIVGCDGSTFYPPPDGGHGGHNTTTGPGSSSSSSGTIGDVVKGACETEGEIRDCHVYIGEHAGITNCFYGIQRCYGGAWTECREGEFSMKSLVQSGGVRPPVALDDKALVELGQLRYGPAESAVIQGAAAAQGDLLQPLTTSKSGCLDPCDPTCQKVSESGAFTVAGQSLSSWAAATATTLGNQQAALNAAGLWPSICYTGSDCEFGMYCQNPATKNLGTAPGTCTHDKCAVGPALDATCGDPCVAAVCAANPNCCTYTGPCVEHAPCVTGAALTCSATDTAVGQVCGDPMYTYCCDTMNGPGWDAGCVLAYGTYSGVACPSDPLRAWDSNAIDPAVGSMSCTQLVHDVCGLTCPNNAPGCDHDLCAIGSGLTMGCDPAGCVSAICAANPGCCGTNGTWSAACVAAIPKYCGSACPATSGVCTKYLPNQVDAQCAGVDLVTTLPCYDNPAAYVPGSVPGSNCSSDTSCGNSTSGLVCQTPGTASCMAGCRGSGGNGCPSGYTCSSTTTAIGTCYLGAVPNNTTAQGYVVLCNVGTQPSPINKPIAINVYNNASLPTSWPATPPGGATRSCSTATIGTPQILPGKCVNVPCQTDPNDQVYVNPPNPVGAYASTMQIGECSLANNWTLNVDSGTAANQRVKCDAPFCSLTNGAVRGLSPHLVIMAENSSLMPTSPAEWTSIRTGLTTFFNQFTTLPWSATGAYATVGFFPDSGTTCTATGGTACAAPPNCVQTTPGMAVINGFNAALGALLPASAPGAGNNPPYITAYTGALDAARRDVQGTLALNPTPSAGTQWNETVVLILGSDLTAGGNGYCGTTLTAMQGLAADHLAKYGIRTFVIAVGPAQLSTAQAIASAGGGLAYYYANNASLGTNVAAALNRIAAYSDQSCSFALPPISLFDPSSSTVKFFTPSGPNTTTPNYRYGFQTNVTQVTPVANWNATYPTYLDACLANCPALTAPVNMNGGSTAGWCYDDPNTPTRIYLCENTCDATLFDPYPNNTVSPVVVGVHSQVTYSLACPSYFANNDYPTPGAYLADYCDNIPGSKPLWSYLGWDTVNFTVSPTDFTSVDFSFQTMDRVGGVCPAVSSFPAAIRARCDATHPCQSPQTCTSGVCSGVYSVRATQANQVCMPGNAGCPVDLVNGAQLGLLNGPMAADCMALKVTLNPNPTHTNTPTVNGFELRYSCPYTE